MAPSTYVEVAPEEKKEKENSPLVPESRTVIPSTSVVKVKLPPRPEEGSFQSSMLEYNRMKTSSRLMDMTISFSINAIILIIPIFAGLYFTDTLNLKQFTSTFLAAPPPPPPPPPAPVATVIRPAPVRKVFENSGKLIAPTVVPKEIAMIKEAPLPPDMDGGAGVPGGVPGGVSGGTMGGVLGSVIGGTGAVPAAPTAPREKPKGPVRVGGRVKEPKLIRRVDPQYPPLAMQTHMQGSVVIDAIIDERGDVVEVKVVSGPPLLLQAALDAVRRWKYEPTYLNDQPVPVQLNVTVAFRLGG